MIIKPKYKGFICTTAHPHGCYKNVEDMVREAVNIKQEPDRGPKNVLVIGASGGYGLASRVMAAFAYKAKTVGVSFEKNPNERHTGTAGYYNNRAFDEIAAKYHLPCTTINANAYSDKTKIQVAEACKDLFGGEKIDLLVYSLAAPKREDPVTGDIYTSVIKPIGAPYTNKTVDFHTGVVSEITIQNAEEKEIQETIKVMGGEDWELWIDWMSREELLGENFISLAYSYIGPPVTYPVYKDGTIGRAKEHLVESCRKINDKLHKPGQKALISVNKALVTQASSAIPVVPLYISLLYKIMKEREVHENCIGQMKRLFTEHLYGRENPCSLAGSMIRMDDYEMEEGVQKEVDRLWPLLDTGNIYDLTDLKSYREEFFSLFGFGREDINYEEEVTDFY